LHFEVFPQGSYYDVRLAIPGEQPIEGPWQLDAGPQTEFFQKLQSIEDNSCTWDTIYYVGTELWLRLTPTGIGERAAQLHATQVGLWNSRDPQQSNFLIRLRIPDLLRRLPWESLYARDISMLGLTRKPRYCIIHEPPPEAKIPPYSTRSGADLSVLILAPENSKLNVSRETTALAEIFARRNVSLALLDKRVTASAVYEKLTSRHWDVVHYIGHGEINAEGRLEIMLNRPDGSAVPEDAEAFCSSFHSDIRLAVFNCCRGDGSPNDRPDILSGLGPMLMRKGVPAVVTMRYEIADYLAAQFARAFYDVLLNGEQPGRIDLAIADARAALSRDNAGQLRSYITPILHLGPGYHRLFDLAPHTQDDKDELAATATRPPPIDCPARPPPNRDLVAALKEGRCVPVIGPGILQVGMVRRGAIPPGPLDLLERFTTDPPWAYPRPIDLKLSTQKDEVHSWLQMAVLQWVCQHHVGIDKGSSGSSVVKEILKQYESVSISDSLRRFIDLKLPALFYTWFDGILHDHVSRGRSGLNQVVLLNTDRKADFIGRRGDERRPLVLLRGSIRDPSTLVITEDDHEQLADRIAHMSSELCSLTRKPFPCSVLFLGLNPREPLVHQLCRKLLDPTTAQGRRGQGPTYFVCSNADLSDQSYWTQFGTHWIVDALDPFLNDLLEAL
jgi:hypothetical protein